jgi:hypothetical protein
MKVVFATEHERINDHRVLRKRTVVERIVVFKDTEDSVGRSVPIAKFWKKADAIAVAEAMGWEITEE